jgi:signal transduction histidine kinase
MQLGGQVVVEDVTVSPIFADQPSLEVLKSAGVRAVLSTPLLSSAGTVLGMISIHFSQPHRPSERTCRYMEILSRQVADYLERLDGERRLEAAREAAETANRAKTEFLAAMSHELRTPLNAIGGYAQILLMDVHGPLTDAQREALDRIIRSERHLLARISDVLDFAKVQAGRVEYVIEDVRIDHVVHDVQTMMEGQAAESGLTLESRVPREVLVQADREKLMLILLNLVANAVKFTDRGGRIIVDAPRRDGASEDVAFLRVSDTGVGIPLNRQDAVFEPFVQIHRSLARPAEGTGLGLAISRQLARGMGGDLRVRSVEREGARFTLTLPRIRKEPAR